MILFFLQKTYFFERLTKQMKQLVIVIIAKYFKTEEKIIYLKKYY